MPFERYLNASPPDDHLAPGRRAALDERYVKHDFVLDQSIFSNNVQFQMPQLMLGPTLPPGGGAEVLPAGLVGTPPSVTASWLADTALTRGGYEWCVVPCVCTPPSVH